MSEPRTSDDATLERSRFQVRDGRTLLVRATVLAAGWWSLEEGSLTGALFGACSVVLALMASAALPPAGRVRWRVSGMIRFVGFFVIGSLRAGADVARRAFARSPLPLDPTLIEYTLRLRMGPARNLFAGTLNLIPGTLSVSHTGPRLVIHVLVEDPGMYSQQEALERAVARATGESLELDHA